MDFSWSTLIIVLLIVIVVYFIWSSSSSSSSKVISSQQDAKTQTSISITDNTYNFAVSTWIYVTEWEPTPVDKPIISSESDTSKTTPNLLISLGKETNVLNITMGEGTVIPSIPNIPLQTWVSIILNVNNGSSIDIFINGKLVQTNALQGPWSLSAGSLYVGSKNGFNGYITMATFHKEPFGPQNAWDTYSSGYGSSGLSSVSDFFNKYKIRFAFVKDNVELNRLDI